MEKSGINRASRVVTKIAADSKEDDPDENSSP